MYTEINHELVVGHHRVRNTLIFYRNISLNCCIGIIYKIILYSLLCIIHNISIEISCSVLQHLHYSN